MKSVSIQEMRFEFGKVKKALEMGEELVLTFRNRPLAKLLPFAEKISKGDDPALHFGKEPVNIPSMSNAELDATIYG